MPKKKSSVKAKKPTSTKRKRRRKSSGNLWIFIVGGLAIILGTFFLTRFMEEDSDDESGNSDMPKVCQRVEKNYGRLIDSCAYVMKLNPKYLKSLACLECSGRTDMPKRFERHVYKRLKKVRSGEMSEYEGVTTQMIRDASDEALENLATSWGPFQIMGYKCLHLNIKVSDLRGKNAVYWGVKWIDMEYGKMLRKGNYRDAFHYHNTGRVFPKNGKPTTYDKNYVPNGLNYMRYF